jgi:UDP-N-acetyl-D-mannosaminuronate dehydrogenase
MASSVCRGPASRPKPRLVRRIVAEELDIGVVGSGYVGLATGTCLAYLGHRVTCIDKNVRLVAQLGEGQIPARR